MVGCDFQGVGLEMVESQPSLVRLGLVDDLWFFEGYTELVVVDLLWFEVDEWF